LRRRLSSQRRLSSPTSLTTSLTTSRTRSTGSSVGSGSPRICAWRTRRSSTRW
jgi:hypothetical protein